MKWARGLCLAGNTCLISAHCENFRGKRRVSAIMPTFYLHLCNGTGFTEDQEGSEHADFEAAHAAALNGLREVMAFEMKRGELNMGSFIEIEDANHKLLKIVSFEEAVAISREVGKRPR